MERSSKIFSLPQAIEHSRQCLLLRTDILKKAIVGCPCFDLLKTFLTSKNDFSQSENKGYLADPGENAGNKPGRKENQNEEEFDPWALPELQDLGPKWSGKFRCFQTEKEEKKGNTMHVYK